MSNRQKLLDKIRALMSKTVGNGCTEAEALSAINKAQEMMNEYEITVEDLEFTKQEKADIFRDESKNPHNIKNNLAVAIAQFCEVKVYREIERDNKLMFIGLRTDIEFAYWLLNKLAGFVHVELVKHLCQHPKTADVVKGFIDGCCARINQKLKQMRNTSNNGHELIVIKNQLIQQKLDEIGGKFHTGKGIVHTINAHYHAGIIAGEKATFARPISGKNATMRIGKG